MSWVRLLLPVFMACSASAEMRVLRVQAKVISFDEKFIEIKLPSRTMRVSRERAGQQALKSGVTIQLTFRGEEIGVFLDKFAAPAPPSRLPASESTGDRLPLEK